MVRWPMRIGLDVRQTAERRAPYSPGRLGESNVPHSDLVLQRRFLNLVSFWPENRFAEGKATKLSSALAGRHEEVLKVPFWRTVVVILGS